jgi:hypothetical protein
MNSYDSHNINNSYNNNNNNTQFSTLQQQPQRQRPRGDSIIFDPVSFQDGGIHELLPGLIEQHGNNSSSVNDLTSLVTNPTNVLSSSSSIQHHHQPLPTRPSAGYTTSTKKQNNSRNAQINQVQPANVLSNSTIPSNLSTISSHSQHRKSNNHHHTTASNTTSSNIQQDTAVTINADGTTTTISLELCNKDGRIGIYLPEARIARIARFHAKRSNRIWRKRIKYDCRKKLADSRPRIKGRFVKRTDMDE